MKTVLYVCPHVPPEWIAAHGLRPCRVRPHDGRSVPGLAGGAGVCPYARDAVRMIEAARASSLAPAGVVLTTVCDQMRRAADVLPDSSACPVFLMNVPTTCGTTAANRIYLSEIERLGRFLVSVGGEAPDDRRLVDKMLAYDKVRTVLKARRAGRMGGEFSRLLAEFDEHRPIMSIPCAQDRPTGGIPVALLGGPLWAEDTGLFEIIESLGGNVVLDATGSGELVMPEAYDYSRLTERPLEEMARVYGRIPDVFRRPNNGLFDWLEQALTVRNVQGIVFRNCLWCDTWLAELARIRDRFGLPVLHLDVDGATPTCRDRITGRLQAFLEVLG